MYSVMAVCGIVLAFIYVWRRSRAYPGAIEADLQLGFIYGMAGAFVGAKLLSVFTVLPQLIAEFSYLFSDTGAFLQKYLYGGFVFYGGLYGAVLALWIFAKHVKRDYWQLLAVLLPSLPLVHFMGRLGCFCMGCCYGIPSRLGIAFSVSPIAPNGIPLFPVQLAEALLVLPLFFLLDYWARIKIDGRRMLGLYLLIYGCCRFCLEFFRGDDHRGFLGPLSISQVISLISVFWAIWLLWRAKRFLPPGEKADYL